MRPIYSNALPKGWIEEPLREMVTLKRGYSWSKEQEVSRPENGVVPVIRIPNIQARLELGSLLYLRDVPERDLEKSAVTKGWILFVASNGNESRIGDSVLIDKDLRMVFASFLMAMTPKEPEKLLPEFLALWMKLHNVHEAFCRTSQRTSGLGNFSWSAVKRLPVRYPASIEEQQEISRQLMLIDEYIALTSSRGRFMRDICGSVAVAELDSSNDDGTTSDSEDDALENGDRCSVADVAGNDAELEAALRLKYAMLQDVVTGRTRLRRFGE